MNKMGVDAGVGRFTAAIAILCFCGAAVAQSVWASYDNARFGYRVRYPQDLFEMDSSGANGDGLTFSSPSTGAKLKVFAALNDENISIGEYRETILKEFGGYDDIDYSPVRDTWFVLSGTRSDTIYYQKVMFSCGGKVVNALSVTYPKARKRAFDAVVTGLEKSFRPGSGSACRKFAVDDGR